MYQVYWQTRALTYDLALSSKRDILWSFHGKCWEVLNSPGWGRGREYPGRSEPLHHNKSGTGKFVNLKIFLCKVCRTFISFLRNYISHPTHIWKIYFKLSTNYFWTAICFHWHIVLNRISKLYILHLNCDPKTILTKQLKIENTEIKLNVFIGQIGCYSISISLWRY